MHRLLIIGGSDAGISAALRAKEIDPGTEVTVSYEETDGEKLVNTLIIERE